MHVEEPLTPRQARDKRYYNKLADDPVRYAARLAYHAEWVRAKSRRERSSKCAACGKPRGWRKVYCEECRAAFREWTLVAYRRRNVGPGRGRRAYKARKKKSGLKALAFAAKVRYHSKKREEASNGD